MCIRDRLVAERADDSTVTSLQEWNFRTGTISKPKNEMKGFNLGLAQFDRQRLLVTEHGTEFGEATNLFTPDDDGNGLRPFLKGNANEMHTWQITKWFFEGRYLVTCGRDRRVKLWNADGNFIRDLNPIESKTTLNSANAAVFTPSKESIIIGRSDGRLWMVPILENDSSNKTLTDFAAHDGSISKLSFVDDGKTLVSFCEDGTIRFWDYSSFLVTGKLSLKAVSYTHLTLPTILLV